MNYQINSKYRKLRHKIQFIVSGLTFKFLHLPGAYRIALFSQLCILGSLYFPWFSIGDIQYGIFSQFLWGLGLLLVIGSMFLIFLMFSFRKKEHMKQRFGIGVADAVIFMFFGILQFLLLFLALQFLHSFSFFTKDISFYTTPVYAMCGSIFTLGGGIMAYRASRREILQSLYVENDALSQEELDEYREILSKNSTNPDKKNMVLPI